MPGMNFGDMGRMQQQLLENPDLMRRVLDSPMMQSLMSNPDVIRNVFMNNPQMRAVLEANPQLNHVLNDPEMLRQTMEAIRNPATMREMMRNQDRMMSNIEAHPGGFNALRRMYEDVQEPLMNAATSSTPNFANPWATSTTTSTNSTSQGAGGPVNSPMPNPWAPAAPAGERLYLISGAN